MTIFTITPRHQCYPLEACGVCCLDVTGGEIALLKILINKGFSGLEDFVPEVYWYFLTLETPVFMY